MHHRIERQRSVRGVDVQRASATTPTKLPRPPHHSGAARADVELPFIGEVVRELAVDRAALDGAAHHEVVACRR